MNNRINNAINLIGTEIISTLQDISKPIINNLEGEQTKMCKTSKIKYHYHESSDYIFVCAELPGVSKNNCNIEICGGNLVIETNTNYGPDVNYVSQNNGSSLKSITELAERKGYKLVCHTGNAFYVRLDLFDKLPQKDYSLENLFISTANVEVMQRKGPDGDDYGSLYYLSSGYDKLVSEINHELIKE